MDDNDIEWMHRYSQEIGLDGDSAWTLKELVAHHKHLRELNKEGHNVWRNAVNEGREKGFEEGRQHALGYEFISREQLKAMTLKEISDLLYED